MADFEAPSFSLGLDCDLLNSDLQISSVSQDRDTTSSNQFSVAPATLNDKDDDFETLIVDDSETEYPDPRPKLKRLRRGLTINGTPISSSASAKMELPMAVVDDEDRSTDEHLRTQHLGVFTSSKFLSNQPGKRKPNVSNACESPLTSHSDLVFPNSTLSPLRRFQVIDSDSDPDDPSVSNGGYNRKCNGSQSYVGLSKQRKVSELIDLSITNEDFRSKKSSLDLDDSLPPAHRYFFHDDLRIQEHVRSRLANFFLLSNESNRDLEQPSTGTSKIDYMGQFRCGEKSKQSARNIKGKKSSSSKKVSRISETEETSQGWVNPKLGVYKGITKGTAKRKVHAAQKTSGHWLTGPDGKKVYFGKKGQELTGRAAYVQYKKENGLGFKKPKSKSASKKKKKK